MANDTLLFKDVIPNVESFISSKEAQFFLSNIVVYGERQNVTQSPTPVPATIWTTLIYNLLYFKYRNYQIRYDNVDDFLADLWNLIAVHVPNYYQRKERYKQLMTMSDKELITSSRNISNFIDHTDDPVDFVFDPLKNITSQNQSQEFADYPNRLRMQLQSMQYTLDLDFLNKFKNLFILFGSSANYYG